MEEEEEEVLCYLDRVLEEEEVFEYGDGELDPISPTHRLRFKVRQRLEGWMQGIYTHTHLCESNTLTRLESSSVYSKVESLIGVLARCGVSMCYYVCL